MRTTRSLSRFGLAALTLAGVLSLPFAAIGAALPTQDAQPAPVKPDTKPEPKKRPPEVSYRLDVSVFQVGVTSDKAVSLEAESLEAQAKTPATLQAALQGLGATQLLYRFDRTITSSRPARLESTATIPVVQSVGSGPVQRAITREQLGARFDIFVDAVEESATRARLNADGSVSLITQQTIKGESPTATQGDAPSKISVPRKMSASFDGLTEVGKPMVMLSIDTNTADGEPGTALVVRILLTRD